MKRLRALQGLARPFYSLRDISAAMNLPLPSTRVFCSRQVKSGELLRVRRDLYVLPDSFERLEERDLFILSNVIQTPSYISLATALSYHGLSTQIGPSTVEAMNPVRTRSYSVKSTQFCYYYCRPAYYFGYQRKDGCFVADPEKALLDCLYFSSLGRYALDESALDLKNFQWTPLERHLKKYPKEIGDYCRAWRKRHENTRSP